MLTYKELFMNLGLPEILLILVVALLFFGPSRLPSLGKSVGEAIRGFKKGLSGVDDSEKESERLERSNKKVSMDDLNKDSHREKEEERKS
jgi:sec-independent protein translocase protein TatA